MSVRSGTSVIVAYVSGHGYGHATRTGEVLRVLRDRRPDIPLAVVSAAPERLFTRAVPGPLQFRHLQCDVGLVQRSALEIDEEATVARVLEFAKGYGALVDQEARWLRASGAAVVVGDIPPLAFDAGADAGLPTVGLGNFSWDWIYRHLGARRPDVNAAADDAARAYGRCALLLALPFAGNLSAFPHRESIPLVARSPRVAGGEARRRLELPPHGTVVLFSFGGFGVELDRAALTSDPSFRLVFSEDVADRLDDVGLGYQDLVGAADVVVTKPGYGIVSDVIGARRRLVYTDRGSFPEYPILVREMPSMVPAVYLPSTDLRAGRLTPAVQAALALDMPPAPDVTGAAVAAARILARI
jgi:L-arabinokinase